MTSQLDSVSGGSTLTTTTEGSPLGRTHIHEHRQRLGHAKRLNMLKRILVIQSIFRDPNGIELEKKDNWKT